MTDQGRGQQGRLPGGAPLASGETVLVADRFMFSTVAFFLHIDLVLTSRRFYAVRPNTLFGLIPVGATRSNFPVENIASVNAGTRFDVRGVVFGAAALIVGLWALTLPSVGIPGLFLIVLGVASLLNCPQQAIEVMNSGGGMISFPVSVLERGRTLEFSSQVAEAIARSNRGEVGNRSGVAPARAVGDAEAALRNLQRLHEQGLITEAEYAAKRSEILARL